jgi:hypothetical protein
VSDLLNGQTHGSWITVANAADKVRLDSRAGKQMNSSLLSGTFNGCNGSRSCGPIDAFDRRNGCSRVETVGTGR